MLTLASLAFSLTDFLNLKILFLELIISDLLVVYGYYFFLIYGSTRPWLPKE